jgi:hypothetical protein
MTPDSAITGVVWEVIFPISLSGDEICTLVGNVADGLLGPDKLHRRVVQTEPRVMIEIGTVSPKREDHLLVVPGGDATTSFYTTGNYNSVLIKGTQRSVELDDSDYDRVHHRYVVRDFADQLATITGGTCRQARQGE